MRYATVSEGLFVSYLLLPTLNAELNRRECLGAEAKHGVGAFSDLMRLLSDILGSSLNLSDTLFFSHGQRLETLDSRSVGLLVGLSVTHSLFSFYDH